MMDRRVLRRGKEANLAVLKHTGGNWRELEKVAGGKGF
jgi:hypothetical protein